MPDSRRILEQLVAFPTVSRDSNLALIAYVQEFLAGCGIRSRLVPSDDGGKANLYATVGPDDRAGILLSGHSDVVPVDGQGWTSDPFRLSERGGRLHARGASDMKGFIACALVALRTAARTRLHTPLHLALSYDEEVGCLGVRRLIDVLAAEHPRPAAAIIGEPTSMRPVIAHKGKLAGRVACRGVACHSSLAPRGCNAIHLATEVIGALRTFAAELELTGAQDAAFDIPWTTVHVGIITGGSALNVVPEHCSFEFEIRNLPGQPMAPLLERVRMLAGDVERTARAEHPQARVQVEVMTQYPALDTSSEAEVVRLVQALTGVTTLGKITFGTEGGLFQESLGVTGVVCGPGDIREAHRADESIGLDELHACDRFMAQLVARLAA